MQHQTANADDLRSGPSEGLLDFLAKLQDMSKGQIAEVIAWRVGLGD